MQLTAQQIIDRLQLSGPTTCGYVAEPYRSLLEIPQSALPAGFEGSRPLGNMFYFLVTPETRVCLHRIRSDQMYHHYLGESLEVLLLYEDGRSEVRRVGTNLIEDEQPQLFIPGSTFHTARVTGGGAYSLLGTSVWLRAEPADVEICDVGALSAKYPHAVELLRTFSR